MIALVACDLDLVVWRIACDCTGWGPTVDSVELLAAPQEYLLPPDHPNLQAVDIDVNKTSVGKVPIMIGWARDEGGGFAGGGRRRGVGCSRRLRALTRHSARCCNFACRRRTARDSNRGSSACSPSMYLNLLIVCAILKGGSPA